MHSIIKYLMVIALIMQVFVATGCGPRDRKKDKLSYIKKKAEIMCIDESSFEAAIDVYKRCVKTIFTTHYCRDRALDYCITYEVMKHISL